MASKVITLPTDNQEEAQKLFKEWLDFDDKILFIVLGDTGIAKKLVEAADRRTGGDENEPQWVVFAEKREDVLELLQTLKDPENMVEDWEKTLAIAVSMTDNICDMIPRNGTQPNAARIFMAFRRAERDID